MTTPYSDAELESMLADLESDFVERKESAVKADAIKRNICALANDRPGQGRTGVVFVGVRDDGTCAHLDITDDLLKRLSQMHDDGSILPLPSMIVQKRCLGGCPVAVVFVEPAPDTPVRYRGRTYVRIGPTVRLASPADEQLLTERRRAGDRPFDLRPVADARLDDLDLEHVRNQYVPLAVDGEILERNDRPFIQQMRSLRLSDGEHPTWGALLAFGNDPRFWLPGAYVQFLRLDGDAITDPIRHQKMLAGRLGEVLGQLSEVLALNVSIRTDVRSGAREQQFPDYPVEALRQLAYNAIMHRSYDGTNTPVRIHWFADRVEISSPGGLYGRMTPDNLGDGDTDYRNPLVAEVMHHLGFAQRFGLGLKLASDALAKNGNPEPDFDLQPTHVRVTVKAAP